MLTDEEIIEIYNDQRAYRTIASEYDIHLNRVCRIKNQSTKQYRRVINSPENILYGWGTPLPPVSHPTSTAAPGNDESKNPSSRPSKTHR